MLSNTPLSREQIHQFAPSVFADHPHKRCSHRYRFIPTINVVEGLMDEGWLPVRVGQSRVRSPDRVSFTKHLLRFRRFDTKLPMVGDTIPEIVLVNSHDGTSTYELYAGLFRLVCSNGMVVGSAELHIIRCRHKGDAVQDVIEGSYEIVKDIPRIAEAVDTFERLSLTQRQQAAFAQDALTLKWKGNPPVAAQDLILPRRPEDQGDNLWSIYQRVQENIMKGGLRGFARTGRRVTTRAVRSVDSDIHLNKALWRLTEEYAQRYLERIE